MNERMVATKPICSRVEQNDLKVAKEVTVCLTDHSEPNGDQNMSMQTSHVRRA